MRRKFSFFVLVAAAGAVAAVASLGVAVGHARASMAGLVNIDVTSGASGAGAIGSAGHFWNTANIAAAPGMIVSAGPFTAADGTTAKTVKITNYNLKQGSQTLTATQVGEVPNPSMFGSGTSGSNYEYVVPGFTGYDGSPTSGYEFVLSGLDPSTTYDLYGYDGCPVTPRPSSYQVVGATTPSTQTIEDQLYGTSWVEGENYVMFTLQPDSNGDIAIQPFSPSGTTGAEADTSAFQIVPVPEPATLGLMALGGLGILLVGRKRKTA
jgi:hypothetical protein